MKTAKQLERYFKGLANHRRIDILFLVRKSDDFCGRYIKATQLQF